MNKDNEEIVFTHGFYLLIIVISITISAILLYWIW